MVSKSVEVSLYLVDLYRVGVDCLEMVCELKPIYPGSHSTGAPSTFDSRSCFLDSDGPITFDSRSGVSVLWHFYGSGAWGRSFVVQKAREPNTSLLGKLVWSTHKNSDALWVQVIKHKYINEDLFLTIPKKPGSVTWNAIMKALLALKDGFQFRLGNGNSSFWYTDWSGIGILANQVLYVDIHDIEIRVRDVYIDDYFIWKGNLNGLYTAHDGYHWLNRNDFSENPTNVVSWSWLWHIPAPEKIKFFLWTALHKALPTKAMLSHRGILHDSSCPRCNKSIFFEDDEFYVWLWNGLDSPSKLLFTAAIWWIWCTRNNLCMNNESISQVSLRMRIEDYAHLLRACLFNQITMSNTKLVKWNALGSPDMILNVDGSSIGNPGVSGFGGLIHNSKGAWAHGFVGNIGFSNILHAELMALYHGLLLAWQLNIKELWCYSDSETAIKLITEPVDEWHHYAAILLNIKDILAREWRVNIAHTFREGNACADYLAKLGACNNEALSVMTNPPASLNLLLLADASGTWFPR
ncbi:hypothetical protein TSUD_27720 [Trifolium subterraneum]|uniref:RNase H type-1 domain-containing protein n=1 Tax=Trifolium subterraneum TaxID=3900 RepID=A0A2Z6NTT1_TRISU|nr:hypothetical protein TSUD_27720 [Trifolium subterraneum]